ALAEWSELNGNSTTAGEGTELLARLRSSRCPCSATTRTTPQLGRSRRTRPPMRAGLRSWLGVKTSVTTSTDLGFAPVLADCPYCDGTGRFAHTTRYCSRCAGSGCLITTHHQEPEM